MDQASLCKNLAAFCQAVTDKPTGTYDKVKVTCQDHV